MKARQNQPARGLALVGPRYCDEAPMLALKILLTVRQITKIPKIHDHVSKLARGPETQQVEKVQ